MNFLWWRLNVCRTSSDFQYSNDTNCCEESDTLYKIVVDTNINGIMYTWSIELLVKSFLAYCNKWPESLSAIHQMQSYEKPHNYGWYTMWSHAITHAVILLLLLTLYNTEILMVCQQPVMAAKLKT